MIELWQRLWHILRFGDSLDGLPSSSRLLTGLILLDLALSSLTEVLLREGGKPEMALTVPLMALGVELGALWLLTRFKNVPARFKTTATAIIGGDTILTVIAFPVLMAGHAAQPQSPLMMMLGVLHLMLLGWGLGFRAFVYYRTLNIGLIQANVLALTLYLLGTTLVIKAYPDLLEKAQEQARAAQQR